jgi:hypothetical protein
VAEPTAGSDPDERPPATTEGGDENPAARHRLDPEPVGDRLPEDLRPDLADHDAYVFPNNNRRRIPGYLYLAMAAVLIVLALWRGDGVFVNRGFLFAGLLLAAFGLYSIVAGWDLNVDERDALVAATGHVGFPVGHASAQMGWRGLLSRPTWRILLYSADEPPSKRGFVLVDGVEGEVVESFVEDNPEDWSDLEG